MGQPSRCSRTRLFGPAHPFPTPYLPIFARTATTRTRTLTTTGAMPVVEPLLCVPLLALGPLPPVVEQLLLALGACP